MLLTEEIIDGMKREDLVAEMESAVKFITAMEYFQGQYAEQNAKHEEILEKCNSIKDKTTAWIKMIGGGIVILFSLMGVQSLLRGYGFSFRTVVFLLIGILLFRSGWKKAIKKTDEQLAEEADAYYKEHSGPVLEKMEDAKSKAQLILNSEEYANARILVPEDYFDSESADSIRRLLSNRRANTLIDAINLYETELHNQRLEAAANRSAAAQERSATANERTAAASERTARASEKSARYTKKIARSSRATARATELNTFINFLRD